MVGQSYSLIRAAAVMKPTDKPLLAGRQPQSERDMRFAGAAVADRDHVFAASDACVRPRSSTGLLREPLYTWPTPPLLS
jgi:hypothetical protein